MILSYGGKNTKVYKKSMENKNVHINLEKSQISGKINKSVFRNLKSQNCGKKKGVVVNSGKSTENIG